MKNITLKDMWAEKGFSPNPGQEESILRTDGPLYITAGPGSGKTRVILWRTVNLIVFKGVAPSEIFLCTFTEKAAKQLKDGLLELLGIATNQTGVPYDVSQMFVGTIHALCQKLLIDRRFSAGRARTRPPSLLDELDQYFFIYSRSFWEKAKDKLQQEDLLETVNAYLEPNNAYTSSSRHKAAKGLTPIFNRFSEEMVPIEAVKERFSGTEHNIIGDLYELYITELKANRKVDFSYLQSTAVDWITGAEQNKSVFKHVIVDEYQDTNAVQERLVFNLSSGSKNICVVGDDDQSLYRFRGATVENFVDFPNRCKKNLGISPHQINLSINYRSKNKIVRTYTEFMEYGEWGRENGNGHYRVIDKNITANSNDSKNSVFHISDTGAEDACSQIAVLIRQLVAHGKVHDPSQIAFLFPSLNSKIVDKMRAALEVEGLEVFAPRADMFLNHPNVCDAFGLILKILGRPERKSEFRGDYAAYHDWLDRCENRAETLISTQPQIAAFISNRKKQVQESRTNFLLLSKFVESSELSDNTPYEPSKYKELLRSVEGLSNDGIKALGGRKFDEIALQRLDEGNPFTIRYMVSRASSVDWSVLDLFYLVLGLDYFKEFFTSAEQGGDELQLYNLAALSKHFSRYVQTKTSVITGWHFESEMLVRTLFSDFMFAIWRQKEGEFEDSDNPFPKGRIPFLTIHQSKGLEFPVVVLPNLNKKTYNASLSEILLREVVPKENIEPLDSIGDFDLRRLIYVALSRAESLLIVGNAKRYKAHPDLTSSLKGISKKIDRFDISDMDSLNSPITDISRSYSFTGDYLSYLRCSREYMVFRRFGFAPSRTTTMFFGSLVHQTLEDLHNHLIGQRGVHSG